MKDEETYRATVDRIYRIVKHADRSARNPSRLSRLPTAIRSNGAEQKLLILNKRIKNDLLNSWIDANLPEEEEKPKRNFSEYTGFLTTAAKNFFAFGAADGEWNATLFRVTCACVRAGMDEDQIIDRVEGINGYIDKQDLSTIKSAVKRATKDLK